jgi:hypothetical protein
MTEQGPFGLLSDASRDRKLTTKEGTPFALLAAVIVVNVFLH